MLALGLLQRFVLGCANGQVAVHADALVNLVDISMDELRTSIRLR
jgi:hypothetical protein